MALGWFGIGLGWHCTGLALGLGQVGIGGRVGFWPVRHWTGLGLALGRVGIAPVWRWAGFGLALGIGLGRLLSGLAMGWVGLALGQVGIGRFNWHWAGLSLGRFGTGLGWFGPSLTPGQVGIGPVFH